MENLAKTAARLLLIATLCLWGAWLTAGFAQDAPAVYAETLDETQQKREVFGVVFHDLNANGVRDLGDKPLPGWTVSLLEEDGATVIASRATDVDGRYEFTDLDLGTYFVAETIAGPEWNNTTPTIMKVEITTDDEVFGIAVDFGNEQPFLGFQPDGPLPYTGL